MRRNRQIREYRNKLIDNRLRPIKIDRSETKNKHSVINSTFNSPPTELRKRLREKAPNKTRCSAKDKCLNEPCVPFEYDEGVGKNVSVYIPSIPQDFGNTYDIAKAYLEAPVAPGEVVVCLSKCEMVKQELKDRLLSLSGVKLFEHKERLFAGPNRNLALEYCSGDIIAYQDADDMPHPRRLQICIGYFGNPFNALVVNHGYVNKGCSIKDSSVFFPKAVSADRLYSAYFPNGIFGECLRVTRTYGKISREFNSHICTGANLVKREVLENVKWRHPDDLVLKLEDRPKFGESRLAEDYEFCMEALWKLRRSVVVNAPLYYYRYFG